MTEKMLIIWIEEDLRRELKIAAIKRDTSMKEIVNTLIRDYIKVNEHGN